MSITDWIALVQAAFLAAAAWFAGRAYQLARDERKDSRREHALAAERQRLFDVADAVGEVSAVFAQTRGDTPSVNAMQRRLDFRLTFFGSDELFFCQKLAKGGPWTQAVGQEEPPIDEPVRAALAEVSSALGRLEDEPTHRPHKLVSWRRGLGRS